MAELLNIKNLKLAPVSIDSAGSVYTEIVPVSGGSLVAFSLDTTPDTVVGADAVMQKSMGSGGETPESEWQWFDEGNAQNIADDTTGLWFEKENPAGLFYRVKIDLTSGELGIGGRALVKGLV